MARRFLDDVRAEINAQIIANAAGLITAPILNPLLIDSIDSSTDDEAVLFLSTPATGVAVGLAWTPINFDSSIGGDLNFLVVDLAADNITTTVTAGFTYKVEGFITGTAGNNDVVELAIGIAGVPVGFIGAFTGRGAGRPQSTTCGFFTNSAASLSSFQLIAQSPGGATVDVTGLALTVTIKPTNNP